MRPGHEPLWGRYLASARPGWRGCALMFNASVRPFEVSGESGKGIRLLARGLREEK